MPSYPLNVEPRVPLSVLHGRVQALLDSKFNGFTYPPLTLETNVDISESELQSVIDVIKRLDILDSWEASKIRNLTIEQINSQVDAITTVAQARAVIKRLAQVTLWLLKREMNEI